MFLRRTANIDRRLRYIIAPTTKHSEWNCSLEARARVFIFEVVLGQQGCVYTDPPYDYSQIKPATYITFPFSVTIEESMRMRGYRRHGISFRDIDCIGRFGII